ncbi:extracellular calcium-sensing receptor-like [Mixophyes fleayi]|uniref:extracellular calcium-sensing receptor-like n=1 Tax=Mixophyes fleayi TaxID=3061075 RepID=UPI003F4E1780
MVVSIYRVLCHLTLTHLILYCKGQQCRLDTSELQEVLQPGDIMLGVVLPIHFASSYRLTHFKERPPKITCSSFHFESYQQLQAMRFAMEEINKDPNILPNVTLGFQAYDSCVALHLDLESSLQVLTGSHTAIPNYRCLPDVPLAAVIGLAISTHSILLAHILGLYRYPQISHYSTSSLLSDRKKFPSFFRTVPSDAIQSLGLAKLVLYFGWTWVGLLALNNDYGQQGMQMVRQELIKGGACVAFNENIMSNLPDHNAPHIVKIIRLSSAKVIVVFSMDVELIPLLDEMRRQNITNITFVASEGWATTSLYSFGKFSELLNGTIGLAFYSGIIPGFSRFLNRIQPSLSLGGDWITIFWEQAFSCNFPQKKNSTGFLDTGIKECTGQENLESIYNSFTDVSNLRTTYSVYTAVHVVAKALEDMNNCRVVEGSLAYNHCADIYQFKPWQVIQHL